jgi:hypothetical protein
MIGMFITNIFVIFLLLLLLLLLLFERVYCLTMPLGPNIIPDISSASICACTRSFNPEKFNAFLMVLFEQYLPCQ